MSEKAKKSNNRLRTFATLVYEESAPENWRDIVADFCVPCLVSPLHDRDVYEKDDPERGIKAGDLKKPHWHLLFMFDGMKSREQISEMISEFGGVGIEVVRSVPGYARYLAHMDHPNKAQYDIDQVLAFGGADLNQYVTAEKKVDKYKAIREIIQFCDEQGLASYAELLKYSATENEEWFKVLCSTSGTVVIREYLKSITWTRKQALTNEEQHNSAFKQPSAIEEMREEARTVLKLMRKEMEEREQLKMKGLERLPDSVASPFDENEIDDD